MSLETSFNSLNLSHKAFDEQFRIPVTTPLFQDSIVIRIWDSSKWMRDDIIVQGRLSFSLLRLLAEVI